mmetsp:Transcript_17916/g.31430  ORF Transcript_17916/g.31430 Transcript_17916/m.31430 type:complete len:316 (+) Transcript_17916:64-1011(+)|eukprot:CAMPEP_0197654536 /NCGR_PEP_ID=MMETSP1338-20131121/38904_1 /TAXON_ID=43686 ORGANISM="Pelagodinium beii, Strain RCC1491" /NCGR_SAMPLE_ID=MMETSP1338 /ASSEMBLY_ACC=CAM_ASM_000754 /LENGTH=315 /DNA_ID=CAMNT_0043229989 /DNA_START=56 /DNA_END=1003 /DNA_ORIENTATION=-
MRWTLELAASTGFFCICLGLLDVCSGVSVPSKVIAPGVQMPMLAFGTYRGSLKECTVTEAVEKWLQLGGRHIDTAFNYGTQPDVGAALKQTAISRHDIFLTTKIPGPIGKENVINLIMNTSLPQLGVDYIDLVLIHYPCKGDAHEFPDKCGRTEWRKERLSTWEGLMELQKAGKIRALGLSNYNTEHVMELMDYDVKPAVNQIQWHLGFHNETLWSDMKQLGVAVEAWAPLAGPTTMGDDPGVSLGDQRLKAVAERYNVSTAQVALRWSTQRGVTPVTATCNEDHAMADLASFDVTLLDEEIEYLSTLEPSIVLV